MNNLLELKGRFNFATFPQNAIGPKNIRKNEIVSLDHLKNLLEDLKRIKREWNSKYINGILISVLHKTVIPKSKRIAYFFKKGKDPNFLIKGSSFHKENNSLKHIFTYYINNEILNDTIYKFETIVNYCTVYFKDGIGYYDIEKINNEGIAAQFTKTQFVGFIVDACYVESFFIKNQLLETNEKTIVTFYDTNTDYEKVLKMLGINNLYSRKIDNLTYVLEKEEIDLLNKECNYLISMGNRDLNICDFEDFGNNKNGLITIPSPTNEPVIGVIDTLFDTNVYFNEWVDYHQIISDDIPVESKDYNHGTGVSSIIVDGPSFNSDLQDNCGRFRVRHFGVCTNSGFSTSSILRNLELIISQNQDIKVWNLSLGSRYEIKDNFISPEGAFLDRLQNKYDIIFVVAGTNLFPGEKDKKIGAPADSLNSMVVNSVNRSNEPAEYSRSGPVLSFFNKPDIAYYGGDKDSKIVVCEPLGESFVQGTSFAAPWIARKLGFLIYKLGFTREVAKALIIDSACRWKSVAKIDYKLGFGVVPIRIEDVVNSQNDEIKFFITGTTDSYETYTYNLPLPIVNGAHPFKAKATLCYFPKCNRNQGVDYTITEMDLHFGRVDPNKNNIKSINNNKQDDIELTSEDYNALTEPNARDLFRKWDNVKHLSEKLERGRRIKAFDQGLWGLSIKTKERYKEGTKDKMAFGVVITFKEINGENRIQDFIKLCQIRGWLVNRIDIDNTIDLYNVSTEEIKFE